MKGVEGFQNEGYTIMTLMRMTFGEFDVSSDLVPGACVSYVSNKTRTRITSCFNRKVLVVPNVFRG